MVQPGQSALHHPAVASQLLAGLDALACDARGDASDTQAAADDGVVVALVTVHLLRTLSWPTSAPGVHGRDGVNQRQGLLHVMHVGSREQNGQRQPVPLYDDMVLAALFPSVRRVLSRFGPPF